VLLLHKVGTTINEENLTKVLTAAGAKVNPERIKVLLDSLSGVDVEQIIQDMEIFRPPPPVIVEPVEEEKEEQVEEEKKEDSTGLSKLFE